MVVARALALALIVFCAGRAQAQVFDMTVDQFKSTLNDRLMKDANDSDTGSKSLLTKCSKGGPMTECHFGDGAFKKSVAAMKEMNLANGKFTQQASLVIEPAGGKVKSVTLMGSKADPSNLFGFLGRAVDVIEVWDPDAVKSDADFKRVTTDLDLMGIVDSDNNPKVEILNHVAVSCNHDSDTNLMACKYEPRS